MSLKRFVKKVLGQQSASQLAEAAFAVPNLFCAILPMRREILLESNPDFACNTYELYRYFLKAGLNKKYKLVWRVREPEKYKDNEPENVYYIAKYPEGALNKIRHYVRCNRAMASISCNSNLPKYKVAKRQVNIYLDHGSQLKSMASKDGQKAPLRCDYLTSQSSFFVPYHLQEYTIREDQIICTGLPRDDQFYREQDSITQLIPDAKEYDKVIIWTPTFRAHMDQYRVDVATDYPYGLPFLASEEDIARLQSCLEAAKVLLVIKPHPVQDLSKLQLGANRNIRVVKSDQLSELGIQINELLAQTDAMITDYSSIYYDYLFTGKPIAITLDDYNQYSDSKGFVFENPLEILKGERLYNLDELCGFIENTAKGIDPLKEERESVQKKINDFDDGCNSKRVYDFLMTKLP